MKNIKEMNACEIIARLNDLDFEMEWYERKRACHSDEYEKLSEEYSALSDALKAMNVVRPYR